MLQSTILDLAPRVAVLHRGARRGTGFAIGDGRLLVLARSLTAERVTIELQGGERTQARLAGVDRRLGLAVLSAEGVDAGAAAWAEGMPSRGDGVFALADPGSGLRITQGLVSAAPVSVRGPGGRTMQMVEHTAPLPSGSGGAPLVDASGAVLGINAMRGDPGFILAIPAQTALAGIQRALSDRPPSNLGVVVAPARAARRMRAAVGLPERAGVLVRAVGEQTPAARAGLRPGDLLVRLGATELDDVDDLVAAIDANAGTSAVELSLVRGSEELQVAVDLGGEGS